MPNQQIWVHGNSGQLQVQDISYWTASKPGAAGSLDYGLVLISKPQDPFSAIKYKDTWLHYSIPMPSAAVEEKRYLPKVRKVFILFATDQIGNADKGWQGQGVVRYKYIWDIGGAWIETFRLMDGPHRVYEKNNLAEQSASINTIREWPISLDRDIEIKYGLGVSLQFRFENQVREEKWEADFAYGSYGPVNQHKVEDFVPEEEPATHKDTLAAKVYSVGCELVPAAP